MTLPYKAETTNYKPETPARRNTGLHKAKIMGFFAGAFPGLFHIVHRFFHSQRVENPLQTMGLQGEEGKYVHLGQNLLKTFLVDRTPGIARDLQETIVRKAGTMA